MAPRSKVFLSFAGNYLKIIVALSLMHFALKTSHTSDLGGLEHCPGEPQQNGSNRNTRGLHYQSEPQRGQAGMQHKGQGVDVR